MATASSTPAPYVVEDCGPNLQLLSDGTVWVHTSFPPSSSPPIYRLPAAHGDAATVMSLVRDQVVATGDPWLSESSADFGRVFISGDQAWRLALPQLGLIRVQLLKKMPVLGGDDGETAATGSTDGAYERGGGGACGSKVLTARREWDDSTRTGCNRFMASIVSN
ncbi:hypothetical protein OsJ_12896 [Oryza sativa Japonica Group]|uniref:Uncharacterized protein n=1 Tax=Oryza sativa subsp. japonica TaxID=39947 RepID=B9F6E3_ORYSJ|nr:hypothetical protein OsJ_12896 [Oryza sativa Japonica Group]